MGLCGWVLRVGEGLFLAYGYRVVRWELGWGGIPRRRTAIPAGLRGSPAPSGENESYRGTKSLYVYVALRPRGGFDSSRKSRLFSPQRLAEAFQYLAGRHLPVSA